MTVPEPPLGREAELARLTRAVDEAVAGRGSFTVLHGPAGIGKTTLADAVAAYAASQEVPVLRAAALEMESMRPFAVLTDALLTSAATSSAEQRVSALLTAGFPAALAESEEWSAVQFQVGEALLTVLDELTRSGPAVLITEDLHWADPGSLRVLGRLLHAAQASPLALLGTVRPLPHRAELATLLTNAASAGATRIDLEPLTEPARRELTVRLLGAPPGPLLERWLAGTGGNPMLITELLQGIRADGVASLTDGRVDVPAAQRPPSLHLAVLGQLSVLSRDTVQLLRIAAVLGSSFPVRALTALTGRPAAELWSALSEALLADVLVNSGDQLAFRHDLIHQAVYEDLPLAVRRALHADAVVALERAGEAPAVVAEHVLRSSEVPGIDSVDRLRRAAEDALASGAPGVACDLLRAALTGPLPPAAADELRAELGAALVAAGQPAEAEDLLRTAGSAVRNPDRRAAAVDALTQSLMLQGRLADAFELAGTAATDASIPASWAARFAARASMGPLWAGDADGALAAASSAIRAADQAPDRPARVRAMLTMTHALVLQGKLEQAYQHARSAVELAESDGTAAAFASMPHQVAAIALVDAGRFVEARAAADAARRTSERFGSADGLVCALLLDGVALFWSGQWDDASAVHQAAVALAEESGTAWQAEALCMLTLISCWRGQPQAAQLLAEAEAAAAAGGLYRPSWLAWARAAVLEGRGDLDGAVRALQPMWRNLAAVPAVTELRTLGPYLASLAAAIGDRGLGEQVVADLDRAAPLTDEDGSALALAAEWARCLVAAKPQLADQVLPRLSTLPRVHETARCCEQAAVVLAAAGRLEQARELAGEAVHRYGQLGADGEIARARAALRSAGIRLGVRGERGRPASGWAALTPTEAEIARLVAARLSNPEIAQRLFLSRRTVAHHVSRVLAKLGMTSRLQLAAAADVCPLDQL